MPVISNCSTAQDSSNFPDLMIDASGDVVVDERLSELFSCSQWLSSARYVVMVCRGEGFLSRDTNFTNIRLEMDCANMAHWFLVEDTGFIPFSSVALPIS
jgi:hypothetical protein